ncbi:MAG: hypothetical protein DCF25_07435 [Leptolyngbya foveolarum]|uniref:Uncharacterized protein n=1 Tax=Leptolyngbya foveolarum TaxID=47253 RepID=A0A2W4WL80_9CYAN|nr:MAG: hypothetical protein DCF25_07435 [Leptolyngbya foveolarum]
MVFNPYQSNLLRFVVGQYQRGTDRHRNAFGQAHTKIKLSAELGTALVVLPVYVAARASVLAGRRLRQSVSQQRFNTLNPRVKKLLNFSGFDVSGLGSLGFEAMDSPSTHLQPNSVSHGAIQGSAQPIFQTLVAVGACLSSAQIRALSAPGSLTSDGSGPSQSRLMRWVGRWRSAARQLLSFDREILSVGSKVGLDFDRGKLLSSAKITGVVSGLKTRSLLLVLDYSAVWNGLSADQQLRLQHQITAFLSRGSIRLPSKAKDSIAVYKLAEPVSTPPFSTRLLCSGKSNHPRVRDAVEADVVSVTYVEHPLEKTLQWVDCILLWIEKQWQRIRAVLHK